MRIILAAMPLLASLVAGPALAAVTVDTRIAVRSPHDPPANDAHGSGAQFQTQSSSQGLLSCGVDCDFASAIASAQGGGGLPLELETRVRGVIEVDGPGTPTVTSTAKATFSDQLTFTSDDPNDHRLVTLHKTLTLDEEFFGQSDKLPDGDYTVTRMQSLQLFSEGIAPGAFGDRFAFINLRFDGDNTHFDNLRAPSTIDFDLTFALNEATNFSIAMLATGTGVIDNPRSDIKDVGIGFGVDYLLRFAGGLRVTDTLTGEELCGLHYTATSRLNYGRVARCDSGGGGGGGGGGGSGATVPEPSTWALMIAGFGGLGVTLRTRRRRRTA